MIKRLSLFPFIFALIVLVSCSETNVIREDVIIDETPDAPAVSGQFQKRVLIEDYTGTWCGNCTRVAYGIEQAKALTERVVSVAIHSGVDPYDFEEIGPLKNLISPEFDLELPQVRLNRIITWSYPEPANVNQVKNLTSNNCGLGLAMTSSLSGNTVELDVNIKFVDNYTEELRLVVYVLENHLLYEQRNYTTYYEAVNPIPDFEHNHVLRTSFTDLLGDVITEGTGFGQSVNRHFSVPLPENVENGANLSFVAFVVGNDNKVINVRSTDIGETQLFEQNP